MARNEFDRRPVGRELDSRGRVDDSLLSRRVLSDFPVSPVPPQAVRPDSRMITPAIVSLRDQGGPQPPRELINKRGPAQPVAVDKSELTRDASIHQNPHEESRRTKEERAEKKQEPAGEVRPEPGGNGGADQPPSTDSPGGAADFAEDPESSRKEALFKGLKLRVESAIAAAPVVAADSSRDEDPTDRPSDSEEERKPVPLDQQPTEQSSEALSDRVNIPDSDDGDDLWLSPLAPSKRTTEYINRYIDEGGPYADRERKILNHVGSTFRGIRHEVMEASGITPADFEGKVVLDLGSGLGGLAKSASVEGIDTTIISCNPELRIPEVKALWEEVATREELRKAYPSVTDEQIAEAQRVHDQHLITDFAHSLSSLRDGSVQVVVDTIAFHTWTPIADRSLYEASLDEIFRVLAPGGQIIVGDGGKEALWMKGGLARQVLEERGIRYDLTYITLPDDSKMIYGARIYKGK